MMSSRPDPRPSIYCLAEPGRFLVEYFPTTEVKNRRAEIRSRSASNSQNDGFNLRCGGFAWLFRRRSDGGTRPECRLPVHRRVRLIDSDGTMTRSPRLS
jgi:hypothetical protein